MELQHIPKELKIRKGDRFVCVKSVVMEDGEIAYNEGFVYTSERDGCITDAKGIKDHYWAEEIDEDCWIKFFKRFK